MATALRHFTDCVALCDSRGFARIAAPNSVMMGHCRIYTCDFDQGLDDMGKGLELALRIGNRHAQMFATQSQGLLPDRGGSLRRSRQIPGRGAGAGARAECAALRGDHSRPVRGSRLVSGPQGRGPGAGSRGPRDRRRDRTWVCGSDPPRIARFVGGRARETKSLRWRPERRFSRKAPSATTTSGFGATRSRARCCETNGTRPNDRPTLCSSERLMNRWPTPHAWRNAVAFWRGAGEAKRPTRTRGSSNRVLAIAAASDMRVEALGIALRAM